MPSYGQRQAGRVKFATTPQYIELPSQSPWFINFTEGRQSETIMILPFGLPVKSQRHWRRWLSEHKVFSTATCQNSS